MFVDECVCCSSSFSWVLGVGLFRVDFCRDQYICMCYFCSLCLVTSLHHCVLALCF